MFLLNNSIMNIGRNRNKSIICIAVSMVMILFLNIYIGNIYEVKKQLKQLGSVMPVRGVISNLNGTQTEGLEIKEDKSEK